MAKQNIPPQSFSAIGGLPTASLVPRSAELIKAYKGWTYACVNAIAEDTSGLKLHLYGVKHVGKEIKIDEIYKHPALSLLQHVNDFMAFPMLLEITAVYLKLLGEAYWVLLKDKDKEPYAIWPLRPDWVKIEPSKNNFIGGYIYQPPNTSIKDALRFKTDEVIPFKELNPSDAYRGYSTTMAGAVAIDTDFYASDWSRNYFLNSAIPGLVFTTDKKLNQETIERFMKDWLNAFKGYSRSHKVAFLGGGMKVDKITDTLNEMNFSVLKKDLRDEIMAMYRVPKPVLGITEDVNKANAEITVQAYMERVVHTMMLRIVTHLNEFLLPLYFSQRDEVAFFDFENPTARNRDLELKVYESGIKNYWLTPNEVREMENLPPVEGGDALMIPQNLNSEPNEETKYIRLEVKQNETKKRVFNVPIPQPSLRKLKEEAVKNGLHQDLFKLVSNIIQEGEKEKITKYKGLWNKQKATQTHDDIITTSETYEQAWKQDITRLLKEQEQEVLNRLDEVKFYAKERRRGKETSFIFDILEQANKWKDNFAPKVLRVYSEQLKKTAQDLGQKGEFVTTTDTAEQYLKADGVAFALTVNETTKDQLRQTLKEGLDTGEAISELRQRVVEVYKTAYDYRVGAIARTEILRTINNAILEGSRQSGIVTAKQWKTHPDEMACLECKDLDGVTVDLEKKFPGDYLTPPAHTSCRCIIIPAIKEKDEKLLTDDLADKLLTKVTEREITKKIKTETDQKIEEKDKEIESIRNETQDILSKQNEIMQEKLKIIKKKIATMVAERQKDGQKPEGNGSDEVNTRGD
jgi:HK97 family phage portal protein